MAKYKGINELFVGANTVALSTEASNSELKYNKMDRASSTIHLNDVVGIKMLRGTSISGKVSYGAIYYLECILSDNTVINISSDVLNVISVLTSDKIALINIDGENWIATPGAKILTTNSLSRIAFTQSEIDEHLRMRDEELIKKDKDSDKTQSLSSQLEIGSNVRIGSTEAVFLGPYWGSVSRYSKKKTSYYGKPEIIMTKPKMNQLFLTKHFSGGMKLKIYPNTRALQSVAPPTPESLRQVEEFNDLLKGEKAPLLRWALYNIKSKASNSWHVKQDDFLTALDITFFSPFKSVNIEELKKELHDEYYGARMTISAKSVPFDPITSYNERFVNSSMPLDDIIASIEKLLEDNEEQ